MKFPYGIMNFEKIRKGGYYFVDRTDFIKKIEEYGDVLFMIRPRRFGKSLWLSILQCYYDCNETDNFNALFGNLKIGKNPTSLHNTYLVLQFDFSKIEIHTGIELIKRNFHDYCNDTLQHFYYTNQKHLSREIKINSENCISTLSKTIDIASESDQKLYILVDEYDNFVNELIVKSRDQEYYDLVTGEGLLKTFFKVLKDGTKTSVDRIFVTGVSPIMMSDISSAFNIAEDIYLKKEFNSMLGFKEDEVLQMLHETLAGCHKTAMAQEAGKIMAYFYNGYKFCTQGGEDIYNPTLTLYFLKNFLDLCEYPGEMLDPNLDMDISKLDYLAKLSSGRKRIFDLIYQQEEVTVTKLIPRFKLKELVYMERMNEDYTWSYLFYHGILTIKESFGLGVNLKIPNSVSKFFYYDRIRELLFPQPLDLVDIQKAFFFQLEIDQVCDYMEQNMLSILSNRDYLQGNELTYKVIFLTVMYRTDMYLIDSEPEITRHYGDLLYIARPDTRKYGLLDLLVEFKYLSLDEIGMSGDQVKKSDRIELLTHPKVQIKLKDAEGQLAKYKAEIDKKHKINLRTVAMVGIGFDRVLGITVSND